jgi:Chaperone of endosialidase
MDADRFDTLTRSLTETHSRRGALAAVLGSSLGLLGLADVAANNKKKGNGNKKKRNKGGNPTGQLPPPPDSTAPPPDATCNPPCRGGQVCDGENCVCTNGTTFCRSSKTCQQCCSDEDCCGQANCPPDKPVCRTNGGIGMCGCPSGEPICGGACCTQGFGCSGGICAPISDRNLKANVASIDPADMLQRARDLPIATWNYTFDDPAIRHIGPMAQDFAALFGVGTDDRHVHPIDGQGVALAAIQGLAAEMQALREENARLVRRLQILESLPYRSEPA